MDLQVTNQNKTVVHADSHLAFRGWFDGLLEQHNGCSANEIPVTNGDRRINQSATTLRTTFTKYGKDRQFERRDVHGEGDSAL